MNDPIYAAISYPARSMDTVVADIIHHSEGTNPTSDIAARAIIMDIHLFHKNTRGWPGFAYNAAIWRDTLYLVRPANRMGWHSAGVDENQNGIGDWNEKGYAMVLLGNYQHTKPSELTLNTVKGAKQYIETAYFSGRKLELRGHMDGWPTECPGDWWPAWKGSQR